MLKARAYHDRDQWRRALEQIANEAGKGSPLYKILGTISWGRFDGEPSSCDTKDNALLGLGFLQGARYAALNAARLYGWKKEERALATINERTSTYGRTNG